MSVRAPEKVLIVTYDDHVFMQVDLGAGPSIEGAALLETIERKPGESDLEFLQHVDGRIDAQAAARGFTPVRQYHPDVYRRELAA